MKAPLQEYHELIDRIGEAMRDYGIAEISSPNGTVISIEQNKGKLPEWKK